MAVLIIRRPRAKTSTSIARSSSNSCGTSISPASSTASASSIAFASATTWFVLTTRWAWLLPPAAIGPSRIPFPDCLPPVEYPSGLEVRKVQAEGWFTYRGRDFRVSKALRGFPVALRPGDSSDALREVLFCHQAVALIDLNNPHHQNS